MSRTTRSILVYVAVIVVVVMVVNAFVSRATEPRELALTEFEAAIDDGAISAVTIKQKSNKVVGEFRDDAVLPNTDPAFESSYPDGYEGDLTQKLLGAGVDVTSDSETPSLFQVFLTSILPYVLIFGIFIFILLQLQGGGNRVMQFGKSKAKQVTRDMPKVTFKDVAGIDEAVEELEEIRDFLSSPQKFRAMGAKIPKGVLLYGPPGTGKTLLARAVAGEAGVPFFSISGSEFVEMFVGVGAARVRDLFEQAREAAPAIVFIDELDALGRARGAAAPIGGHDEREQTLNQLLTELDGFDPSVGVVLLAATNRPEILDPALLRAGRFDRQVLIDRPDKAGRAAILKVHMKKARIAAEVDPEEVAALTTGFTGADLANLVNEAALLATRRRAKAVEREDFTRAIERIVAGLEKRNRLMNPLERRIVAVHEIGHALTALCLPGADQVHKVSIIPRGVGALGYTIQRPTEDRFLMTREELETKITVLLGGRAAEHLVFGQFSTGAADDLARATDIARSMATQYGMDDDLGHAAYEPLPSRFLTTPGEGFLGRPRASEVSAEKIDGSVRSTLDRGFVRATELLRRNRKVLDETAEALLARETLGAEELAKIAERLQAPGEPVAAAAKS